MSWIWLIPIVAAIAGGLLVLRTWLEAGPTITITFKTAEGLDAGKTQIRYKDVNVGLISSIRLSEDRSHVIASAQLVKEAASLAQEGSVFWVVRPRLGLSGVSGLGTLLSGAYIGVDAPAKPEGSRPTKTEFAGLEIPPEVTQDRPGKRFYLTTDTLGSLDIGSPVYFRRIPVGQVIGYQLDDNGREVNVQVFIDAPNDRFVTKATRFWNASGVDFTIGANGLKVRTQSLLSVALGGLAFEDIGGAMQVAAPADANFHIYGSEDAARAQPDNIALKIRMRFDQSVRGLNVGAPIDFNGIALGDVTHIDMGFDAEQQRFFVIVDATIYPDRLGSVAKVVREYTGPDPAHPSGRLLSGLIERGLRAQLRTGNLLTGQLYVALDVFPNAPRVVFKMSMPADIPTVPNNLEQIQQQLVSIANKLEKIPFDQIGADLRTTLSTASRLMTRLDKQVAPAAQAMMREASKSMSEISNMLSPDSNIAVNTDRAIQELSRAARSLRILSDYLQAHPESLIRGRPSQPVPEGPANRAVEGTPERTPSRTPGRAPERTSDRAGGRATTAEIGGN